MSKAFKKYEALIKLGAFTESEIIYFRKAVNGCSKLPIEKRQDLIQGFIAKAETKGIRLTQDQQWKGYKFLTDHTYKKNGNLRKTPVLKGDFERNVLKNYDHFTCSGLYQASDNNFCNYVPIYRMYDTNGNWFEYSCNMGQVEVLAIGKGKQTISCKVWPDFNQARGA